MEYGPADRLSDEQIEQALRSLDGWIHTGDRIEKTFVRADFRDAVAFIHRIADEAERMDHHPDILLHKYKHIRVMLTTHSAGGITPNDLDLARTIEHVA
jgi:4a-hydroxytetrahydrobiopterin dehydratase